MKVYLFDEKSGLYEGEDYWDNVDIRTEEGVTTQAPPITQPGQLPIYDKDIGNWKISSTESLRKMVNHNE